MSYQHFTKDERNELAILSKKGYLQKDIAEVLGKHPSSISRELKKNKVNGEYVSKKAHQKAKAKRSKSKYQCMKIVEYPELQKFIEIGMKDNHWTPEEIAGRWNGENHTDMKEKIITVSTPSIYKFLYCARGQYLCQYLVSKRYTKKKRKEDGKTKKQLIPNRVSIEQRPENINDRSEFGHWEGDTLGRIKTDSEVVIGLSERVSRFILIDKMPALKHTVDGFKMLLNPHRNTFKSLTLDNGVENIKYERLNLDTYFCHPYSSWEKGSMENLFGRLRRFIPKKASLKDYTREQIIGFAEIMNNTPRKCLNWKTPREVFEEQCALNNLAINLNIYSHPIALDYLM